MQYFSASQHLVLIESISESPPKRLLLELCKRQNWSLTYFLKKQQHFITSGKLFVDIPIFDPK
jgi:hypothetical protein